MRLLLVIWRAVPATTWEQLDSKVPKAVLWSALGIIVVLSSAYIIYLRKRIKDTTAQFGIPTETIAILLRHNLNDYGWSVGAIHDKPAMQVSATFIITNKTDLNIHLCGAKIKKPKILGGVSVEAEIGNRRLYGWYDIPGKKTTIAHVDFWIIPPFKEKGEPFSADIAIADQFGNEHWIKGVAFPYRGPA